MLCQLFLLCLGYVMRQNSSVVLLKVFIRMPLINVVMLRERLIFPNKVLSED